MQFGDPYQRLSIHQNHIRVIDNFLQIRIGLYFHDHVDVNRYNIGFLIRCNHLFDRFHGLRHCYVVYKCIQQRLLFHAIRSPSKLIPPRTGSS